MARTNFRKKPIPKRVGLELTTRPPTGPRNLQSKKPTFRTPPRPGTHAPSSAPQPAPAPAPAPQRPLPVTPGAAAIRNQAGIDYAGAQAAHNRDLYLAALQYGDLDLINSLAGQGFGPSLTAAPQTGDLAGIDRGRTEGRRQSGINRNTAGTFFSSLHSKDLSDIEMNSEIARSQALQRYKDAESHLAELLGQALSTRNTRLGEADQMDFDYANSLPPEATGNLEEPTPGNPWAGTWVTDPAYKPAMDKYFLDYARNLWKHGKKKGTEWRKIIDQLGYDPRVGF